MTTGRTTDSSRKPKNRNFGNDSGEQAMNSTKSGAALWDKVSTTDAKYTKQFSRGGGFKGTAINATWLVREATKTFGPCGIGWGFSVLDEQYIKGAGQDVVHVVRLRLWYMLDGQRGEVEQYGQTVMVGTNKNGAFTDDEAPKKSITDAMSKCLSLIGFGADIHLGLWDDNKYASDRESQRGISDRNQSVLADHIAAIDSAADMAGLKTAFDEAVAYCRSVGDRLAEQAVIKAKDAAKARIAA